MCKRIVSPEKAKEIKITKDILNGVVKEYDEDELRIYHEQLNSMENIIENCFKYEYELTQLWDMMKSKEFTLEEIDDEIEEAFFWADKDEKYLLKFLNMNGLRLKKYKYLKMFEEEFDEDMSMLRLDEDLDEAESNTKKDIVQAIDNFLIYSGMSVEEIFEYIIYKYPQVNTKILI